MPQITEWKYGDPVTIDNVLKFLKKDLAQMQVNVTDTERTIKMIENDPESFKPILSCLFHASRYAVVKQLHEERKSAGPKSSEST